VVQYLGLTAQESPRVPKTTSVMPGDPTGDERTVALSRASESHEHDVRIVKYGVWLIVVMDTFV